MNGLLRTLADHDELDVLVAEARRRLVAGDTEWALERLAVAERAFAAHRQEEEARWIPLFAARCAHHPNATPAVLLRDHRLIASLFAHVPLTDGLRRVDLLEDLAGALEHHTDRERAYFKPRLDAVVTPAERAALLRTHDLALLERSAPASRVEVPWSGTPETPIRAVREAVLATGTLAFPVPLPEPPFRAKAERILADLPDEPVERLARLRRLAWLFDGQRRVGQALSATRP